MPYAIFGRDMYGNFYRFSKQTFATNADAQRHRANLIRSFNNDNYYVKEI